MYPFPRWVSLLLIFVAVFGARSPVVRAQDVGGDGSTGTDTADSPDAYAVAAEQAIREERYEFAIQTLKEGQRKYPGAYTLSLILGNLYSDKELYRPALEEYRRARTAAPEDFEVLYKVAQTEGKLNRDHDSIRTLSEILELYPDMVDVIADLGWMYFKTYQHAKGEELLLEAGERLGMNRSFAMTLGTLYSGMYDYANAKKYYLESIEDALSEGREYFASVAYYNLSLLEHGFYNYNSALEYTDLSLQYARRAPGHIAKGELFQVRMEFERARSEYMEAYQIDTTPLSTINLADLFREFGLLEQAEIFVREVMDAEDLSWMYYFGTDLDRHAMDLHEILSDTYEGLAARELIYPEVGIVETVKSLYNHVRYRALGWYHDARYRTLALNIGRSFLEEGNELDAYWLFYQGNEGYRRVAMKYLLPARSIEIAVAPGCEPFYVMEEGKTTGRIDLLLQSANSFHPVWEREGIHAALISVIPLLRRAGRTTEARRALSELYEINPGALIQNGLGLPVLVEPGLPNSFLRKLRRAGFDLRSGDFTGEAGSGGEVDADGYRFAISFLKNNEGLIIIELTDIQGRVKSIRETSPFSSFAGRSGTRLVRMLLDTVYAVR